MGDDDDDDDDDEEDEDDDISNIVESLGDGDTSDENQGLLFLSYLGRKEGDVLFNDALNTFYLRLYGVRHMVKDHSDSEKGNPLSPHRLLFTIISKGSFICTIPQTG